MPEPQFLGIASKLFDAVEKIDRPADFCAFGQCPIALPGLFVKELGDIGLPLSAAEAKRLIKVCKQAPYGKGTETVVDTKVRKVWELATESFKLRNPKWDSVIESTLRETESKLGLPNKALAAQLYKLLIYETGSFFLPHRDGEKLDRMVATLVICLPSKHSGGELVVTHQGQQQVIAMPNAAAALETDFAAFYADCQHEVKPLLRGYRLCLTYNLVLAKPRSNVSVEAPKFVDATKRVASVLSQWQAKSSDESDPPKKLAVTLEHRYTEAGLSIDKLKGVDLAKANVLFDAAEHADCDAYLALVTLYQSGEAAGGYDEYSYGYGSRHRYSSRYEEDEDDEDEDSSGSSEHTMGEIYDSSLNAKH
ncbi:MAG: 2OG-Fe(II) oxygenase, partial [Pirellula sp.]